MCITVEVEIEKCIPKYISISYLVWLLTLTPGIAELLPTMSVKIRLRASKPCWLSTSKARRSCPAPTALWERLYSGNVVTTLLRSAIKKSQIYYFTWIKSATLIESICNLCLDTCLIHPLSKAFKFQHCVEWRCMWLNNTVPSNLWSLLDNLATPCVVQWARSIGLYPDVWLLSTTQLLLLLHIGVSISPCLNG